MMVAALGLLVGRASDRLRQEPLVGVFFSALLHERFDLSPDRTDMPSILDVARVEAIAQLLELRQAETHELRFDRRPKKLLQIEQILLLLSGQASDRASFDILHRRKS